MKLTSFGVSTDLLPNLQYYHADVHSAGLNVELFIWPYSFLEFFAFQTLQSMRRRMFLLICLLILCIFLRENQ